VRFTSYHFSVKNAKQSLRQLSPDINFNHQIADS